MSKVRLARDLGSKEVEIWGSGSPLREFLHVDDCVDALVFLAEHYSAVDAINVGSGFQISIRDLAVRMCEIAGFDGELRFDNSRPDGAPRKRLDIVRIKGMGWQPAIDFGAGLNSTYQWFLGTHTVS